MSLKEHTKECRTWAQAAGTPDLHRFCDCGFTIDALRRSMAEQATIAYKLRDLLAEPCLCGGTFHGRDEKLNAVKKTRLERVLVAKEGVMKAAEALASAASSVFMRPRTWRDIRIPLDNFGKAYRFMKAEEHR